MILIEILIKAICYALAGCAGAVVGFYLFLLLATHGWL